MNAPTPMRAPKAYAVSDDEHAEIVFANSIRRARTLGASLLGCDGDELDDVKRAPEFDEFGSRRAITAADFLDRGWWFECAGCSNRVDASGGPEWEREDDDEDTGPSFHLYHPRSVWCSDRCREADLRDRFDSRARECALCEEVTQQALQRWPGIEIRYAYANAHAKGGTPSASVSFWAPGLDATDTVEWRLGRDTVQVPSRGIDAWNSFVSSLKGRKKVTP